MAKSSQSNKSTSKKQNKEADRKKHVPKQQAKDQADSLRKTKPSKDNNSKVSKSKSAPKEPKTLDGMKCVTEDHMPKKGQIVYWKSIGGKIEGTVDEIDHATKKVTASSTKSGNPATHKFESVFF